MFYSDILDGRKETRNSEIFKTEFNKTTHIASSNQSVLNLQSLKLLLLIISIAYDRLYKWLSIYLIYIRNTYSIEHPNIAAILEYLSYIAKMLQSSAATVVKCSALYGNIFVLRAKPAQLRSMACCIRKGTSHAIFTAAGRENW